MGKADLTISEANGVCSIKVSGRANFDCGMPLRNFAKNFDGTTRLISIDLTGCESMDSTFMGILTMLALRAKKSGAELELVNVSDYCRNLLNGLGVEKMFTFRSAAEAVSGSSALSGEERRDKLAVAEAVVEAHKTLMDVSLDNIAKFEKVVEFAESDVERLKKEAATKGAK